MEKIKTCNVSGVSLSEDEWNNICFHPSYTNQTDEVRNHNKMYTSWGANILLAAYSIYVYKNSKELSAGELSRKLSSIKRYVVNSIYSEYDLEKYVKKGNGEENKKHTDIVYKLIALIYHEKGFYYTFSYLLPWFNRNETYNTSLDYKTIIQEYAQSIRLKPEYSVVSIDGPDHALIFTVKITIGSKFAVGKGGSKKKAEKDAAKAFMEQYSVKAERQTKTKKRYAKVNRNYSDDRKKQLYNAAQIMGIPPKTVRLNQLDEIFTHSSYINERNMTFSSSNDCLNIVGANLLQVLCYDYLLEQSSHGLSFMYKKEIDVLLDEKNLEKGISDKVIDYTLKSKGFKRIKNPTIKTRIKIDILKATVAAQWINYLDSNNETIEMAARIITYNAFKKSENKAIMDYRTALQEVVQSNNFIYQEKIDVKMGSKDDNPDYNCNITVLIDTAAVRSQGQGHSKRIARNNAAKEMLILLLPYCNNKESGIPDPFYVLEPEIILMCADKGVNDSRLSQYVTQEQTQQDNIQKNDCADIEAEKKGFVEEVSFDCNNHTLYICKGSIDCRKHNHKIISATGILVSLSMTPIKINVNYCCHCGMYFINYQEFMYYKNMYGILLGNFHLYSSSKAQNSGYAQLADESVLKICGYTVNQSDNLSSDQRHYILSNMMDRRIIAKYQILEYLQFFINNSKRRHNMRIANLRWREDLEWVREYRINEQRHFIVDEVKTHR